MLHDRKVIVVFDRKGKNGKSKWLKHSRLRPNVFKVRKLLAERPDRLRAAVYKLTRKETPDLIVIDLPKAKGKDTDLPGLFEALEDIKNG